MRLARHLPRFQRAYRALDELTSRERWRREEIEAWQIQRLNALWTSATRHTPYYAALKRERVLPDRFSTLGEFAAVVPVLRKPLVHQYRDHFLAQEPGPGAWRTTSGSTGMRTSVFWPREADREALQARYRLLAEWGIDFFDPSVMVWSDRLARSAGPRARLLWLRRFVEDRLRNRRRFSINEVSAASLDRCLRRMSAFRPAHIYAFSSGAYLLARGALDRGFTCPSIQAVVVTADLLLPHMRAAIGEAFGAPVVAEYGAAECGLIAGQSPDGTLRVREDQVLVETAPRDDGRYDILVTPFANAAFPLIRYELGDVTDAPLRRPARGFSVLRNLGGRSNDLLVSRSGSFIHESPVSHLFETLPGIRRYRLRQDRSGAVSGQIEVDDPGDRPDISIVERRMEDLLHGYPVRLEVVGRIVSPPSGKHRWIVTDLSTPLRERPGMPSPPARGASDAVVRA